MKIKFKKKEFLKKFARTEYADVPFGELPEIMELEVESYKKKIKSCERHRRFISENLVREKRENDFYIQIDEENCELSPCENKCSHKRHLIERVHGICIDCCEDKLNEKSDKTKDKINPLRQGAINKLRSLGLADVAHKIEELTDYLNDKM